MSAHDLQRLMQDLQDDPLLLQETESLDNATSWQAWASSRGYVLTLDEASTVADTYGAIDDDDLEQVAGGWTEPNNSNSGSGGSNGGG
ncbi:MAG: hypothetical protein AAF772_04340 [Acidobacteriota bacterium]